MPVAANSADEGSGIAQAVKAVTAATPATTTGQLPEVAREPANQWLLLGVPWVVGVGLFLMQWVVLSGAGRGSIDTVDS